MKIRLPHYIFGIGLCFILYSFVNTSWKDRIKYLFLQHEMKIDPVAKSDLILQKRYVLEKMEQHRVQGIPLQSKVTELQKQKPKDGDKEKIKQETQNTGETLTLLHQYRLWQLQAKAMIGVLDKTLLMRFQGKTGVTPEALMAIIVVAKQQLPDVSDENNRSIPLQEEVDAMIEEQFALFFTQLLKSSVEEQQSKVSLKNYRAIFEVALWFQQNEQLKSYFPLIDQNNISIFDVLQVLLEESEFLGMIKSVAGFIEKVAIIIKDCSDFKTCLSAISFINKQVDIMTTGLTSTFEMTGKNFTTITKALNVYQNHLASRIITALKAGTQLQQEIEHYYALMVPMLRVLSMDQKKEYATLFRTGFFAVLHRYVAICDQQELLDSFSTVISIFSTKDSIALLTADGLPPKEIAPIRVLLLTLHARLNQCGGRLRTELKESLQKFQESLYKSPRTQQVDQLKNELNNMLVTQVSSLSDKEIKSYETNVKQFVQLFLGDSYDVKYFLEMLEQKPVFIKQLDALGQVTKDQNIAKRKFFITQVQEFSQFIKDKYQFLRQLYNAITQSVASEQKDKILILAKEWIMRESLVYERLRKLIRAAVLSKNDNRKIDLMKELKDEFVSLLPILMRLTK